MTNKFVLILIIVDKVNNLFRINQTKFDLLWIMMEPTVSTGHVMLYKEECTVKPL